MNHNSACAAKHLVADFTAFIKAIKKLVIKPHSLVPLINGQTEKRSVWFIGVWEDTGH